MSTHSTIYFKNCIVNFLEDYKTKRHIESFIGLTELELEYHFAAIIIEIFNNIERLGYINIDYRDIPDLFRLMKENMK